MYLLKNIFKSSINIAIFLLQILLIQNVFSTVQEDFSDNKVAFKRDIHIAYVEDSPVSRGMVTLIVAQYNKQSPNQRVILSLDLNESDFMNTHKALEDVSHFDIIFTDMQMNEKHAGFLVAKHLRKLNYLKPIIILSDDHIALQAYLQNRNPESAYHAYSNYFSDVTLIHPKLNLSTLNLFLQQYAEDQNTINISASYDNIVSSSHDTGFSGHHTGKKIFDPARLNDSASSHQEGQSSSVWTRLRSALSVASKNCCTICCSCFQCSDAVHAEG